MPRIPNTLRWLSACALALAACKVSIPHGFFVCQHDSECPESWECRRNLCSARLDPTLDAIANSADSGINAQLPDTGAAGSEAATSGGSGSAGHGGSGGKAGEGEGEGGAPALENAAIASAGDVCAKAGERACTGERVLERLRCEHGQWRAETRCDENQRCDAKLGAATQGQCREVPAACLGQQAGTEVCDGQARRVCSESLLELEAKDCAAHSHCVVASPGVTCECDAGYVRGSSGACEKAPNCTSEACAPGGTCIEQEQGYSCKCDEPGYEGTGTQACTDIDDCATNPCGANAAKCVDAHLDYTCTCKTGFSNASPHTCVNIDECSGTNACTTVAYPCEDTTPYYRCTGQFLESRMPDISSPNSQPSYTEQIDAIRDNVTGLLWQNNLPSTGSGCGSGGTCSWPDARDYCNSLVLAGYSEWRLPSRIELESLLDWRRPGTAIAAPFPALSGQQFGFWSSSRYSLPVNEPPGDRYWYVDFREGWAYCNGPNDLSYYVRCVR